MEQKASPQPERLSLLAARIPAGLHRLVQSEATRLDSTVQEVFAFAVRFYFEAPPDDGFDRTIVKYATVPGEVRRLQVPTWSAIVEQYASEMPLPKVRVLSGALIAYLHKENPDVTVPDRVKLFYSSLVARAKQYFAKTDSAEPSVNQIPRVLLGGKIPARLHRRINQEAERLSLQIQSVVVRVLFWYFHHSPRSRDRWLHEAGLVQPIATSHGHERPKDDRAVLLTLWECVCDSNIGLQHYVLLDIVNAVEWDLLVSRSAQPKSEKKSPRKYRSKASRTSERADQ